MIRRLSALTVLALLPLSAVLAQNGDDPAGSPAGKSKKAAAEDQQAKDVEPDYDTITFWKAELPGGSFVVAHDSINAVSSQEYVLDGAARVTEVNVSTSGSLRPRFYFIEPLAPSGAISDSVERAQDAVKTAAASVIPGDPIWAKVVKEYPTTTHAGTIEYRLESKGEINALYKSLEDSWIAGRSEVYRPGGTGPLRKKDKKDKEDPNGEESDNADDASGELEIE